MRTAWPLPDEGSGPPEHPAEWHWTSLRCRKDSAWWVHKRSTWPDAGRWLNSWFMEVDMQKKCFLGRARSALIVIIIFLTCTSSTFKNICASKSHPRPYSASDVAPKAQSSLPDSRYVRLPVSGLKMLKSSDSVRRFQPRLFEASPKFCPVTALKMPCKWPVSNL